MPIDIDRLRDAIADRYRIEREIGRGGMAVVYLARDLRHDRRVAVKVLRPELAAALGKTRFHYEIEIAARLTHPHILPLYNSGESDDFLYYVMPYVDGETLRTRLDREEQLPIEDAVKIACEIADGLAYAHGCGIVHRDIKPGNILLAGGHAIIADFGIARAISAAGGEGLTRTGVAVGSPVYMSPEQASGDERVDGRSDIYSLACVLYEMLAGEPPFSGRTPQAVLVRRLTDSMVPICALRDTVPRALEEALSTALSNTPADRYLSADQFAAAIETAARRPHGGELRGAPWRLGSAATTVVGAVVGYLIASLLLFELAVTLTNHFGLPGWFLSGAMALALIGLPVLTITALVQTGPHRVPARSGVAPSAQISRRTGMRRAGTWLRARLTWRGAVRGGLLAFALWGLLAAGWILIGPTGLANAPRLGGEPMAHAGKWDPRRIAVLYFEDFSREHDLGYLANGLTEAVIDRLSQVGALKVISRNGVKPFRDSPVSLDSIARALRVGTVIEGSVARAGDQLRVNAQISETAGKTQLASLSWDRAWGDEFAIVDDIVDGVSRKFRERLGVEIRLREREARSVNPRAWELVQRAEKLREDHRPLKMAGEVKAARSVLLRADSLLEAAASLDPVWAEPVVLRGWVAGQLAALLGPTPGVSDTAWLSRGLRFAGQALKSKGEHSLALELRGTLRYRLWQASDSAGAGMLTDAEKDLRAAVASNPSHASAWATLSELLHEAKADFREAKQAALRAYEEDAFLVDARDILFRLGNTSLELGEFEDAVRWTEEGRRRYSDVVDFVALQLATLTQFGAPNVERAWELVREVDRLTSPQHLALYTCIAKMQVAAVLARAGLADSARSVIRRTRAGAADDPALYITYEEAHAWLLLGDREEALRALRKYLEASPREKAYEAEDPYFQDLHGDPRFEELVGAGG